VSDPVKDVQRQLALLSDDELTHALADTAIAIGMRCDISPHEVYRAALANMGWPESEWPKVRENVAGWLSEREAE
jgi:hypothetical protein